MYGRGISLLRDDDRDTWRMWLAGRGVAGVDPARGQMFNDSSMVLEGAVRGQGVAPVRLRGRGLVRQAN
jgi:hypothetical protein